MLDADRCERVVHCPLHLRHRRRQLRLDAIEQRGQVEAAALVYAAGREVPPRAGSPAILRRHPLLQQRLPSGILRDDMGVQPSRHLGAGGGASQRVELVGRQGSGLDDESSEELGLDVTGVPELERHFVVRPDLPGQRADVAELHPGVVVGRPGLRVVLMPGGVSEAPELSNDVGDRYFGLPLPSSGHTPMDPSGAAI